MGRLETTEDQRVWDAVSGPNIFRNLKIATTQVVVKQGKLLLWRMISEKALSLEEINALVEVAKEYDTSLRIEPYRTSTEIEIKHKSQI